MNKLETMARNVGISDETHLLKIQYGMSVIKTEIIKFMVYIFLFAIIGQLTAFIYAATILTLMRIFSGGLHFESAFVCGIFSFLVFFFAILVLPQTPLPFYFGFGILFFALITFLFASPVVSEKRPVKTKQRYYELKTKSVIAMLLICVAITITFFLEYYSLFFIGVWIVFIQAIQLVVAWFIQRKRGL